LFAFFSVIWPRDKDRLTVWQSGADAWFWIHVGQAVLFAALSLTALNRLARLVKQGSEPSTAQ
jgi:hypothetical protein